MEIKNNSNENVSGFCNCLANRKIITLLVVVLVVFLAVKIIDEVKSIGKDSNAVNSITVSGKGEVLATPDTATFSFSVTKEALSVSEAQKVSTEKMNAVLAYLAQNGVDKKDIKTTSYNIYPRYEYSESGKQSLAGYVVSQSVEVKVKKLEDAGRLLSGVSMYGATNISSLYFSNDKQDDLSLEARDKAIKDAREQAQVLARSLGVKLGKISGFYESSSNDYRQVLYGKSAVGYMADEAMSVPQLPSGENKITSTVNITYEIK